MVWRRISTRGASLVELLLAVGVAALFLPALATGLFYSRSGIAQEEVRVDAVSKLRQTEEVLRQIRESGWNNFANNGTFYPTISNSKWALSSGATTSGLLTTSVVISGVNRDSTGKIVSSGGTNDPSTKKVLTTISWSEPIASQVSSIIYMTRYLDNISCSDSTKENFDAGTLVNTQTTDISGGEVTLASNNKAKWCDPHLSSSTIDLPGKPVAVYAIDGQVFVATGDTASASSSFAHVLVGNTDPPSFTLNGTISGFVTNGVFGEQGYGYLATTDDTKTINIINLNQFDDPVNKIYHQEGYFNPSGTTDAQNVFVLGSRGYATIGNRLYVFNLSSKSGSRTQIGNSITFANSGDDAGALYVRQVGNSIYAFIAVQGSTPEELKIANVTNNNQSSQWRIVGSLNIEPNNCSTLESGKAIYVNPGGDRAYISSVNDTSFKEFFVINTSSKSNPTLVGGFNTQPSCTNGGGYEAGGMDPEQSAVVGVAENRAVLVGVDAEGDGTNSEEYQVLDLSDEGHPVRCGGIQFDQGIYGVAAVTEATDGDTFAYLITGDSNYELKVVQGGPDGKYVDSGTFESRACNAGYSTAFNRLGASVVQPANTEVRMQVGVAQAVLGSCAGAAYTFVGPDGSGNTYFNSVAASVSATVPFGDYAPNYTNPGQCFKYKFFLTTTDSSTTPVINDVTTNYSP